jgi:hypothetical protein
MHMPLGGGDGSSGPAWDRTGKGGTMSSERSSGRVSGAIIAVVGALLLGGSSARGVTLYVDDDAPLGGDGLTWDTAYHFLQDALARAGHGSGVNEIHVGQGVYKPDQDEAGNVTPGDREATFQLIDGVALMGAYAGFGTPDPEQRDYVLYETILSGDLAGNDVPDFQNNDENSYNVVTGHDVIATAVIDGCFITGGNADGSGDQRFGAGIHANYGSPTIRKCVISANIAESYGGGIRCFFGSTQVIDSTISGNVSGAHGGGVYFVGAGMPLLSGCVLTSNTGAYGGGVYIGDCEATVSRCVIAENAAQDGGGVECNSPTLVVSCLIQGNSAEQLGGGIKCSEGTEVVNCTVVGNATAGEGGGIRCQYATPIVNCVVWGNEPQQVTGPAVVTYSDVQGGMAGQGNIDADPLFVDSDNGDCHLLPGSPCIDAADNTAVPDGVTTDLDGNPRFVDDPDTEDTGYGTPPIVDMGAYEYQPSECPADFNGDGIVNTADLLHLLGCWGTDCGDVNGDGTTNTADLLALLAAWGECA